MPKSTVTLADFEELKNESGLVPMRHLRTLGTEYAGQIFGYTAEVALRMFERDMAEPYRGFTGTPDGDELDKQRARAAAEEEAAQVQAERERAERERVLARSSRTAQGSALMAAVGAPARAATPLSATDPIEQESRDELDGEGEGEEGADNGETGATVTTAPGNTPIPANWRKDHHLVQIRLAKAISGSDVSSKDDAVRIIETEEKRRAGGGAGAVTSADAPRRA